MKGLGLFAFILFFNLSYIFCSSVKIFKPKAVKLTEEFSISTSFTPIGTPAIDPQPCCHLHECPLEKFPNCSFCLQCTNDFKSILEEFLKKLCLKKFFAQNQQDFFITILRFGNLDSYYYKDFLPTLIEELETLTIPEKSKHKKCSHAKTVFQVCFARPNLDISEPESIKAITNSIVIALYNLYPQGLSEKTLEKIFNFVQENAENFLEIIGYKTESIYDQ